ncbi:hypothetical protein EIQ28_02015 [Xanthomonas campestris pv. plantaginis]
MKKAVWMRQRRSRSGHQSQACVLRPGCRALARPPARDLMRHGCRTRASMDGFTACPAPVGGQGTVGMIGVHGTSSV